jgi:hypothetical protein
LQAGGGLLFNTEKEIILKPRLVPIYFEIGRDQDFDIQMGNLHRLLDDDVQFLPPLPLGADSWMTSKPSNCPSFSSPPNSGRY